MAISVINYRDFKEDMRLDARYYTIQYIKNENLIKKIKYSLLKNISENIVDGPFGSDLLKEEYCKNGIPLFRVKNIKDEEINLNDLVFISKEKQNYLRRSKVLSGDIVLTKAGTIGCCCVVPNEIPEANITSHLAKIKIKRNINPYYVSIFLNSKIGKLQIYRRGIKSTRPELNLTEVGETKIFIPTTSFQLQIEKQVKLAYEKRKQAEEKYKKTEYILLQELGIKDLDVNEKNVSIISYNIFKETSRLDAEYYMPKFVEVIKTIENSPYNKMKIRKFITNIKYGTSEKVAYSDKGIPFLRVTDINDFNNIEINEVKKIPEYEFSRVKDSVVKKDDIIISRTGTIGKAIYIDDTLDNSIFGSYFIKVSINKEKINPLYLCIFINSLLGQLQFERNKTGAIQTNLTIPVINNLKIIILDNNIQTKLCKEYLEAIKLRKESQELIKNAKKEVEDMIEKEARK